MANAPMMHALLSCDCCRRRRGARCVAGRTRPQRTARAPPRAQRPIGRRPRPGGACCGRSSTSPPRRRCGPPSTSRTRGAPPRCGRCASRCPPASCSTCRRCGGTPSRSAQTGRASQRSQSTTGMSLKDRRRREQEKNSFFFLKSKTFFESFRASLLIIQETDGPLSQSPHRSWASWSAFAFLRSRACTSAEWPAGDVGGSADIELAFGPGAFL